MKKEHKIKMYESYKKSITKDLYEVISNFKYDIDEYDQYLFDEFIKELRGFEEIICEINEVIEDNTDYEIVGK